MLFLMTPATVSSFSCCRFLHRWWRWFLFCLARSSFSFLHSFISFIWLFASVLFFLFFFSVIFHIIFSSVLLCIAFKTVCLSEWVSAPMQIDFPVHCHYHHHHHYWKVRWEHCGCWWWRWRWWWWWWSLYGCPLAVPTVQSQQYRRLAVIFYSYSSPGSPRHLFVLNTKTMAHWHLSAQ